MGSFWLPEEPGDVLTGNLSFSHEKGISLQLVGDFANNLFDDAERRSRIIGVTAKKRVTLDGCSPGNHSTTSLGLRTQEYRIDRMWLGHHFAASDETRFTAAIVTFDDLPVWVGRSIVQVTHQYRDGKFAYANARFEALPEETISYTRGTLTLGFQGSHGGEPVVEYRMRSRPFLKIGRAEATNYDEFLTEISRIQDLITICTDRPCGIRSVHFENNDIPERALNGRSFGLPKKIELRASQVHPARPDGENLLRPHTMLLSFDQFGGLPMIGKWLSGSPKFSPVLGSLMSSRYRSKMYAENRFLNMTTAAESLHRLIKTGTKLDPAEFARRSELAITALDGHEEQEWIRGILRYANEPSLGSRLRKLAKEAKPAMRGLIRDFSKWSSAVVGVRNRLTHLEDMGGLRFDGADMYWLSESIYDLTRVVLLKEIGLSAERLESLGETAPYNWYSSHVQLAVTQVLHTLSEYESSRHASAAEAVTVPSPGSRTVEAGQAPAGDTGDSGDSPDLPV
jgi:hypothetical protein